MQVRQSLSCQVLLVAPLCIFNFRDTIVFHSTRTGESTPRHHQDKPAPVPSFSPAVNTRLIAGPGFPLLCFWAFPMGGRACAQQLLAGKLQPGLVSDFVITMFSFIDMPLTMHEIRCQTLRIFFFKKNASMV